MDSSEILGITRNEHFILGNNENRVSGQSTSGRQDSPVMNTFGSAIDHNPDNAVISYSIQLPSSLAKGCRHIAHTFQSSGLSPTSLPGIFLRATDELVHVLVSNLNRDFHTDINPQSLLRDPIEAPHIKDTSRLVVLLGGSNLSNTAPYITAWGYKVWDLSQRGLVLSGGCIDSLIATITASDIPCDAAVILDLFGNSIYRWRQEDGTMALPVKSRNGYHLPGPMGVCEEATFKKLIETSLPLFEHFNKHRKVVIPPLPRFLFRGCCSNYNHSVNISDENYTENLLDSVVHLRKNLKLELLARGVEKVWITECFKELFLLRTNQGTKNDAVVLLRDVFAPDGVHLTQECYSTMAQNIVTHLENRLSETSTAEVSASVSVAGARKTFFWRGFCSPAGSLRLPGLTTGNRGSGGNRPHPYNKGRGRNGNNRN
jgi:hypothetical protein